MMRIISFLVTLLVIPVWVSALGLGKLELNSGLNQPFNARIELLAATATDIEDLNVSLADIDAFKRAGIDRPFVLSNLKFKVQQNEAGPDYIIITSREVIREPYLNFLVEANWPTGRLFREYTVLLDPPLYDPNARRMQRAEPYVPEESYVVETPEGQAEPVEPVTAETTMEIVGGYTGNEYGPVAAGETLWSIAGQVRPDASVSMQQMMLALLRTNPEAFLNNNINGLKRGQILRIPARDEIGALGQDEALQEVKLQNSSWAEVQGVLASSVSERAEVSTVTVPEGEATGVAGPEVEIAAEEAELRLVAAAEGAGETGAGEGAAGGKGLALANEQLKALSSENLELKDRIAEAETIIDDLKRLIALKDDELAAMQQQLSESQAAKEAGLAVPAPTEEIVAEEAGEEQAEEAKAPVEEKKKVEKVVKKEEKPVTETRPPKPAPVEPTPPSLVEQVMTFIMGNLVIVGGGLLGVIVVIALLVVIARRKRAAGEAAGVEALPTEFPDFAESSEDETELPVEPSAEAVTEAPAVVAEEAVPAAEVAVKEAAAPAEEVVAEEQVEEEDPLAEVNVFLAYEHFDQAEEFVRDAIASNPDNLDFHAKLLEVFYAAGNKKSYEEAAQVLHDKVNGEGPHWDMALAMWQEMSPNRALFAAPAAGEEEEAVAATGGGIVDLTSEEPGEEEAGLDFDLGIGGEPAAEPAKSDESEEILDITAGTEQSELEATAAIPSPEEDILDVTAAVGIDELDDESLLDVTAAVGLDTIEEALELPESSAADDNMLDITGGAGEENAAEEGEDLLDVTAHTDLEAGELEEDLLDVTSATSAGADSEELLEVAEEKAEPAAVDDSALDFDIGGIDMEPSIEEGQAEAEQERVEDNVIEFGTAGSAGGDEESLEFDISAPEEQEQEEGGVELDLSADFESESADKESGLEIDFGTDDAGEISLETEAEEGTVDLGTDLELTMDEDTSGDKEIDMDETMKISMDEVTADADTDLELQLDTVEKSGAIDMDETVEIPSIDLDLGMDEDEGGDDHTVFVPRSGDGQEQTSEDETATKLDLAKAYVELGDKESAKAILDEVIAEGNEEQRQQAQDLLNQVD